MSNTNKVSQLITRASRSGCCRETKVLETSKSLRAKGELTRADAIEKAVANLASNRVAKVNGLLSKYIDGAPSAIDKYFETAMSKYKNFAEAKAYAINFYCKYVDPKHSICQELVD